MPDDFIQQVYNLTTQEEIDVYYSAWAASYDEEVTRQGYRTPGRCAEALARFVPLDRPILDLGCGTGVSGKALQAAGFSDISGQDINGEMLAVAERSGLYQALRVTDPTDPFPFQPGRYDAIAAVGVIGVGAAPASLLGQALDALAPGGHLVFSYNEAALAVTAYAEALEQALSSAAQQVFSERGPHFDGLGSSSVVYVLRRNR